MEKRCARRRRSLASLALTLICSVALPTVPQTSAAAAERSSTDGRVDGQIQLERRGRRLRSSEGVVVWLEGVPETLPDTSNVLHEVRMHEKRFVPEVSVVLEGTTISFPNDDRVYHNPFSSTRGAEFDLGQYGTGETGTVKATQPGAIEVHCDVHEQAAAKIFVLETTYFAVTDEHGAFSIDGVPPGTYAFVASAPWGESQRGHVLVKPGRGAEIRLALDAGRRPRHRRKDWSAYEGDV
jgi:plastocyanin